jgi:hypothetical protein
VTWFILTRKERKEKKLTSPLTLTLSRKVAQGEMRIRGRKIFQELPPH